MGDPVHGLICTDHNRQHGKRFVRTLQVYILRNYREFAILALGADAEVATEVETTEVELRPAT